MIAATKICKARTTIGIAQKILSIGKASHRAFGELWFLFRRYARHLEHVGPVTWRRRIICSRFSLCLHAPVETVPDLVPIAACRSL